MTIDRRRALFVVEVAALAAILAGGLAWRWSIAEVWCFAGSDSYGAHDRTMVGEVVTGQPPEDDVIVRSGMQSRDTYDTPDVRTPVVTSGGAGIPTTSGTMNPADLPPGSLSDSDTTLSPRRPDDRPVHP